MFIFLKAYFVYWEGYYGDYKKTNAFYAGYSIYFYTSGYISCLILGPGYVNPEDAVDYTSNGFILVLQGRYEEALKSYDKAIELDPQYALAWYNKGCALNLMERHEEALQAYNESIELDPQDADAWGHKGDTLVALGRHQEAQVCYDKAKELGYTG